MKFFKELKDRKVTKWMAIYTSTIVTIIYLSSLFSNRYNLPPEFFNITIALILFGFPFVFVLAWNHGKSEKSKIKKGESATYLLLIISAVFVVVMILSQERINILPADSKTIAVLPFENLSDSKEDEYFSNGITEDILIHLSKISDLKVISRTSVMKYKKTELSIPEIAKKLNAGSILEGSIRRIGDHIRIVSQLVDAHDDNYIWSETYDRDMKDIFKIQSEVASNIAYSLKAALTPKEKELIESEPTKNLDAYAFYLKGREHYNNYKNEENEVAIEFFKKALVLDPNYSLAYAGLADAYGQRVMKFDWNIKWIDSAIVMSKKAILINPDIAEPYKALGLAYSQLGYFRNALLQYDKALEINPNYSPALFNAGLLYYSIGKQDAALPLWKKFLLLNPGDASAYENLGYLYLSLADDSKAIIWLDKCLKLQPNSIDAHTDLSNLYIMQRRYDLAKVQINELRKIDDDNKYVLTQAGDVEFYFSKFDKAFTYYKKAVDVSSLENGPGLELTYLYLKRGETKKTTKNLDILNQYYLSEMNKGNEDFSIPLNLARLYAIKNNNNEAINYFRKAIEYGWRHYRLSVMDPMFADLQDDKMFTDLILELKEIVKQLNENIKKFTE